MAPSPLARRYRAIGAYAGLVSALCGGTMGTPLLALLAYPAEWRLLAAFLVPAALLTGAGTAAWRRWRPRPAPVLTVADGGIAVVLAWGVVTVVSAVPFMAALGLGPTGALFEAVSGWTTTGLSVVDVATAPRTILLWRSVMQLAGGAGMAILLLTVASGPLGPGLAVAEGRSDQLVPHVRHSARLVARIYAGYALVGVFGLRLAGMSWFDAVNHAFAAVSTGGFSTRSASIGHWDSAGVEAVTLTLMVLGSANFQLAYLCWQRRWRAVRSNPELRLAGVLAMVAIPVVYLGAVQALDLPWAKALRVAVFETVSAITTTGFNTVPYGDFRGAAPLLLVPLMLIGGGSGSTAGGVKQLRVYVLLRSIGTELRRLRVPRGVVLAPFMWRGTERVFLEGSAALQVAVFCAAYGLVYAAGVGVLIAAGVEPGAACFEYASALGTVGLSVGVTGPDTGAVVLWAEMAGMLLGRLEVLVVFVALAQLWHDARRVPWRAPVAATPPSSASPAATPPHEPAVEPGPPTAHSP